MRIKRVLYLTAILTVLDQGIKLIIFNLYMDARFTLLPNVLLFCPVQNKNLNYLGSLLEVKTPLALMILLEIIGTIILIMAYRYCLSIYEKHHGLLTLFLSFGLAGISASFIDSVFWGGSIDFIRLFNWFTFDLKDVYLSIMEILLILYMLFYIPEYNKLSKEDRKKYGLIQWIKNGCPAKPIEKLRK